MTHTRVTVVKIYVARVTVSILVSCVLYSTTYIDHCWYITAECSHHPHQTLLRFNREPRYHVFVLVYPSAS